MRPYVLGGVRTLRAGLNEQDDPTVSHDLVCSFYTVSGRMPGSGADEASLRSFEARVKACATAGFVGIGSHVHDYTALARSGMDDADITAILAHHGMRYNEVEFLIDWYLDAEDPSTIASREVEAVLFKAAAAMKATHVNVGEYGGRQVSMDRLQSGFHALCGRAAERGLRVALEFMPFSGIPDLAMALDITRGAGAGNGGVLLDAWHLHRSGSGPQAVRALKASDLTAVQLSDVVDPMAGSMLENCFNRALPGEGGADNAGFVAALNDIGYDGPIAVEIMSPAQAARGLSEAAEVAYGSARRVIDGVMAGRQPEASAGRI